jgi:hypothetical protein
MVIESLQRCIIAMDFSILVFYARYVPAITVGGMGKNKLIQFNINLTRYA